MTRLGRSLRESMGFGASSLLHNLQVIAHSSDVQALMDELFIPWGVQYELARGVSRGWLSWSDVTRARLEGLRGNNKDSAAKVAQVFPRLSAAGGLQPDLQLWAELDREELAICEGRLRGLGLQGEWEETEDWYGGKIQQVARLEEEHGSLLLVLAPMEMRKSNRFARFLGSRRILQVSIPREMRNTGGDDLRKFFTQKFVLCGRVFVAFGAKDGKVFLMETNEDYERAGRTPGDNQRMSLEEFVAWHNPMDKNGKQAVSKWATRFDLGLSISVPALQFEIDKMFNINDDFVPGTTGKRSAEHIYTDGCGFMNGAALSEIGRRMGYSARPTAVQGRIAGAKGLWMLHPRERNPFAAPKIWIRESQRKINLDFSNLHPAHRIFDLLAPPRVTLPSRLSRLTILNLSHNGVPTEVFVELMKETLDEQVQALTQWTRPQDMQLLWATINRIGHVSAARIQQYALGASRALGLSGRIREDDDFPSDEPSDPLQDLLDAAAAEDVLLGDDESAALLAELEQAGAVAQSLRDKFTGEPLTLHGVVLDLLQAGFNPLRLPLLYEKLKKITSKVIEDVIRDFHVSVPLSAEAFIVPDPYGVLKEGEIHFKSTKDLKPPLEDLHPNILLGDVLIYRNPNRLPSDVQKVRAVQHESLADYVDVIVLPTKGPCSFASMLAGGDVCVCIYDPRLVETFRNSPLSQPPEGFLKDNFEDQGKIEQVTEVAAQMSRMAADPDARRVKLQHALLSDVSLPPIGAYSAFHENAAYVHGYNALQTVRIAFMFNTILDSRKTGLRVKEQVYRTDKRQYDKQRPECLQTSTGADGLVLPTNVVPLKRPAQLGPFVLDELLVRGKRLRDDHLSRYEALRKSAASSEANDPDLLLPYHNVRRLVNDPLLKHDLALIRAHVDTHIKRWQSLTSESQSSARTPSRSSRTSRRRAGSSNATEKRNKWKELAQSFASGPNIAPDSILALVGDVDAIKASWAYSEKPNFAWRMAFQALCRIKATTQGSVAMTGRFADSMSISASAVRVLEQSRLGMS
ncbi:hypothetical protein BV20DRAFT_1075995 [Pilatotrama ljubarskyi]|nr:hypothetical protein BV20DRAFT_1075995 [Pilatotrama ljubarskyi]